MRRSFAQELSSLSSSIEWAFAQQVAPLLREMVSNLADHPLLVVGSGGSLSGAHFLSRVHELITGRLSRPITPLEFCFSSINPNENAVLFLTASGNNQDILSAFQTAVDRELAHIGVVCANPNGKIVQRAKSFPHVRRFEYENPAGRDGFLALHSLLSTCIIVSRAYRALDESQIAKRHLSQFVPDFSDSEWSNVLSRNTILGLGSEWAWPAVVDLESKFSESGLGNVLVAELRNFAHGRHHWLVKKGVESGLVLLETPLILDLSRRTVDLLPKQYPRASLRTSFEGPLGGLDLLKQVFWLVNEAGKRARIDPGRPRVPQFGRKIYHLSISSDRAIFSRRPSNRDVWLARKVKATLLPVSTVAKALDSFLENLSTCEFSGIVFDYDGTLCDAVDRFTCPAPYVGEALDGLLSHNVSVGIATGRGRSVQHALREVIGEKHWATVLIGNYNCSVIAPLQEDPPHQQSDPTNLIQSATSLLYRDSDLTQDCKIEVRNRQISLLMTEPTTKKALLERVLGILSGLGGLKIVQSAHSIDILDRNVSKTLLVDQMKTALTDGRKSILVIGDQGQYGGNDFELLSLPYSLSVSRISTSLATCWNLSPLGVRGSRATVTLMKALKIKKGFFKVAVAALERERRK